MTNRQSLPKKRSDNAATPAAGVARGPEITPKTFASSPHFHTGQCSATVARLTTPEDMP